jgi:hypothetical protein
VRHRAAIVHRPWQYLAVAPHMNPNAAARYASTLLSVVLSSKDEM